MLKRKLFRHSLCLFFFTAVLPFYGASENSTKQINQEKLNTSSILLQGDEEQSKLSLEQILNKARELNLSNHSYWHILLHYKKHGFGVKSTIDTPEFFNSPDGRTNPLAELEETIKVLYTGEKTELFPARYKWLIKELNLNHNEFPSINDEVFLNIKKTVNPSAVHLIFPAGYMKNPASMFGHTFLLFENASKPKLMGQGVSFAARNTDNPGFIYAVKGLFGVYYGDYVISPYSKEILKYSSMDMRDIWEYQIKLNEEQLDMLLRHTIELSKVYSKYYYTSQNCSYNLMTLLESGLSDYELAKRIGGTAEPLEVVKILHQLNLTHEPVYRPSLSTQINYQKNQLTKKQSAMVKKYCYGNCNIEELNSICSENWNQALNLALNYLKFLLSSGKISQDTYKKQIMPVLTQLSKIKEKVPENIISTDYPHLCHDSHQIQVAGGYYSTNGSSNFSPYTQLYFRYVNHDLMDNDKGTNKNAQLGFFSGAIQYFPQDQKVVLKNFDFVNIMCLPPVNSYFLMRSTEIKMALEQNIYTKNTDNFNYIDELENWNNLALSVRFFTGLSWKMGTINQAYLLLGADTYFNPDYDYFTDFLPGGKFGLITSAGPWKQQLYGQIEQGITDFYHTRYTASIEENIALSRNFSISARYNLNGDYRQNVQSLHTGLHFNF